MSNITPLVSGLRSAVRQHWRAVGLIGGSVGCLGLLFALAAGWLSPARLTPDRISDALQAHDGLHPGFRRAHAKGICFTGRFESNGQGVGLSKAEVFAPGQSTVIGRFSTGGGQPYSPDGRVVFHAIALSVTAPDGEPWRTAMDDTPIFNVATPQAFLDFQRATRPGPDGKPDMAKVSAFLAVHPETQAFLSWLRDNPLPSSFANGTYYSINAFRFTDAQGRSHFVRWSLVPEAPLESLDKSKLGELDKNFLFDELVARAQQGPLRWHLVITLARAGDPVDNATIQWPDSRQKVDVGILVIDHILTEEDGPCRDLNFDPLILPPGIGPSDDPLLSARSAVYSSSFTRRAGEPAQPSAVALKTAHVGVKP